jgi:hypothetical protein
MAIKTDLVFQLIRFSGRICLVFHATFNERGMCAPRHQSAMPKRAQ